MKARIGLTDNSKVVEFEVDDPAQLRADFEQAVAAESSVYWVTDVKGRSVGVPVEKVAFVEIDSVEAKRTVGFSPTS